jgi:hypothetical protein
MFGFGSRGGTVKEHARASDATTATKAADPARRQCKLVHPAAVLARPALSLRAVRATPLVVAACATDFDVVPVADFHRAALFARRGGGARVTSEEGASEQGQRRNTRDDRYSGHGRSVARAPAAGQPQGLFGGLCRNCFAEFSGTHARTRSRLAIFGKHQVACVGTKPSLLASARFRAWDGTRQRVLRVARARREDGGMRA